jgi:phytoene dehydrogenase-like protein
MADVAVVGSGPNGLAAAVVMARAGHATRVFEAEDTVGGGARTVSLFDADIVHDLCSAVHPMAAASRFFREFDLRERGVELLRPEVAYAHPLDGGAGLAYRDLARTCERLGPDGGRCRSGIGDRPEPDEGPETRAGAGEPLPAPKQPGTQQPARARGAA